MPVVQHRLGTPCRLGDSEHHATTMQQTSRCGEVDAVVWIEQEDALILGDEVAMHEPRDPTTARLGIALEYLR
jgi:hypothetical protein